MLLTVKEFADKHNVSITAIWYQVRKRAINSIKLYGKTLIDSEADYTPIENKGRKKKVLTTKTETNEN